MAGFLTLILLTLVHSGEGQNVNRQPQAMLQTSCSRSRDLAQAQVDDLRQTIRLHQDAIRKIEPTFSKSQEEIEDWLDLSEKTRSDRQEQGKGFFVDLLTAGMADALKKGLDSSAAAIGPVKAQQLINKHNITNPKVQDFLWALGRLNVQNPTWTSDLTRALNALAGAATTFKGQDWVDFVDVAMDVAPNLLSTTRVNRHPMLRIAGTLLSEGRWITALVIDYRTASVTRDAIEHFVELSEEQLRSLDSLAHLLTRDVQRLRTAEKILSDLEDCRDDFEWQSSLQRQRLNALLTNPRFYIELLKLHSQIFREGGVDPCKSPFFPQGCADRAEMRRVERPTVTQGPRSSRVPQGPGSCGLLEASSVQEALTMEAASHKDVCWHRVDGALIATSDLPPDQNYKPLVSSPVMGMVGRNVAAATAQIKIYDIPTASPTSSASSSTSATEASHPAGAPARSVISANHERKPGISFRWNGVNSVLWYLIDSTQKHELNFWGCDPGKTCTQDIDPGNYFVQIKEPGFQLTPVTVVPGRQSEVAPPVGQVSFRWNGANSVIWYLIDGTQKYELDFWGCDPGKTCTQDVSPGSYFIQIREPGFQLIPVSVTAGRVSEVTPQVGQISFRWNGTNSVIWYLIDGTQKYELDFWGCDPGKTCTQDVSPGNYFIQIREPGFQLNPVSVTAGRVSEVMPQVGQISFRWNGANSIIWYLIDGTQQYELDFWGCDPGKTCTQDVSPGNYFILIKESGQTLTPVAVSSGSSTVISR
jgi:hypothetical protein